MSINRETWHQIGYLEGLRVHRNELRRNVKSAGKLLEKAKIDLVNFTLFEDSGDTYEKIYYEKRAILAYAAKMKIQAENFYKSELERLCGKNSELKKFMNARQERNEWNQFQIFDSEVLQNRENEE